jgi:thioredoxin reductase
MFEEQIHRNGVEVSRENVRRIESGDEGSLRLRLGEGTLLTRRIIVASWSDLSYFGGHQLEWYEKGSKRFLKTDDEGRTSHPQIYATGRIAGSRHQTVVAAGDGADVGLSLVEDLRPEYYHDWVAPEGYFTDRGREVPDGCE